MPEPSVRPARRAAGRLLALDLGTKRVGVAVCDELRLTVRPLPALRRSNWKQLVRDITALCNKFDAQGVVVGLPLRLDGTEGDAAAAARHSARNLQLTLKRPVHLQDERLTSYAAEADLRAAGHDAAGVKAHVDSAAAALLLEDFLARTEPQALAPASKPDASG